MAAPGTYKRGYRKPTLHRALMTVPYHMVRRIKAVPSSFQTLCKSLSIFLNDTYGDCVTAEECQDINTGINYIVPDADVLAFGKKYDLLDGADLPQVMQLMAADGLPSGGTTYRDGPFSAVNIQDYNELCAALMEFQVSGGPPTQIKLGVASDQMEAAMDGNQPFSFFVGFKSDSNTDHCTAMVGFGTAANCLAALNQFYSASIPLPASLSPSAPAIIHYTWGQYQLMDYQSLMNICSEAYIRNPSLVGVSPVNPPIVPPTPINPPIPGTGPTAQSVVAAASAAGSAVFAKELAALDNTLFGKRMYEPFLKSFEPAVMNPILAAINTQFGS